MNAESRQPDATADLSFRDLEEQMLQRIRAVAAQHELVSSQLKAREASLDDRRRTVDASHAKLAELAAQLAAEREAIETRTLEIERIRSESVTRARRAESDLSQACAESDALKSRLERTLAESESSLRAITVECDRLRNERDQLGVRLDELVAEFARSGAASSERLRTIQEQSAAEIDRIRRGFEITLCAAETRRIAAENRLVDALREIDSLRHTLITQAGCIPAQSPSCESSSRLPQAPVWLASRPGRLRNIRAALRRRALELRAWRDELSRRESALESLPALTLHHGCCVKPQQRNSQHPRGFTKAAGVALLLATLGGASWMLSGLFGNTIFEANATLGVHPEDRPLSVEELMQWNIVHRELLSDPLFHAAAAARFRNIGEYELADASRLGRFITSSVTVESHKEGELVIRLRDARPEDAQRRLESIASALTCYINGAANLRLESATTKIAVTPIALETPISSDRSGWAWRCLAVLASIAAGGFAWFARTSTAAKPHLGQVQVSDSESNRRAA